MMTMMMKKITAEPDVLASNKTADHNKSLGHFLPKSSVVVWLSREKYCPGHQMQCSVVTFFMLPGEMSGLKNTKHLAITCQFGTLPRHPTENAAPQTTALDPPHPVA